jgi:dTDP-4-dehydrorhamnose 3,5-epimerase
LVYVTCGAIIDVILDIRKNSSTYLHYISVELSSDNRKSVFIPRGLAHGFKSLEDNTVTVYNVATEYDQDADCGVKYDSFGFDWNAQNPILSKRDLEFKSSNEFNSPF